MTRSPYFPSPVLNYSTSPYPADEVKAIRTEKEKERRESSNLNTSTLKLGPSLNRAEDISPSIIHLPHVPVSCELDRLMQEDRSNQWRKPLLLPPFVLFVSSQLQLSPIGRPAFVCVSRKFRWFETKRLGIVLKKEDEASNRSDAFKIVVVDPPHEQRTDH
ncbi:hypothetical protein AGABI1DRAFT_134748 [Agaricus bisporus var. burnettii JB137-S8]|uniref:Uncharacterized protein n=1 Tax=Agaricus bisporus var. burnettii (strain JB137-S8 / ATCC MYA-4627 / FGSC 10392) TaxID=597362 RepID=K5WRR9_AGABU|nr:uncharacterized protein AGABI1DRAFT_134748 [Agaricus bisporus var. burnettii JB137-S8]EKM73448.1 hypothetical protein AGABI1DRAFT_134748 [Agaricus bisporus var. burnettii JB137-S8]